MKLPRNPVLWTAMSGCTSYFLVRTLLKPIWPNNLFANEKEGNIVVSTQVVNEVINGVIKHAVMNEAEICELISRFYARYTVHQLTEAIQLNASRLRDDYSLSHWDSLIVSTALAGNAEILYSEDMHNGLVIDKQLTIVNPFTSRISP